MLANLRGLQDPACSPRFLQIHPNEFNESRYVPDDEIDLIELGAGLWAQRRLIAAITAGITAIAGLYALVATPTYEAVAELRPVTTSDYFQPHGKRPPAGNPAGGIRPHAARVECPYDTTAGAAQILGEDEEDNWTRKRYSASRPKRKLSSGMGKPATTTPAPASPQNTATRKQRRSSPIPWWI